jgi:hypothetical protein
MDPDHEIIEVSSGSSSDESEDSYDEPSPVVCRRGIIRKIISS